MKKYVFYQDPGHGWLKVTRKELEDLKIADKITGYSYQLGDNVYLEEDQDLLTFCQAKGINCTYNISIVKHTNQSSKIRSYDSYEYLTEDLKHEKNHIIKKLIDFRRWDARSLRRIKNASIKSLRYWEAYYQLL